jgi:hypothetical protein
MKFKKGAKIETSDFWYDLTDGGYIKPEKLLKDKKDIEAVENALKVLNDFQKSAESQGILNYF